MFEYVYQLSRRLVIRRDYDVNPSWALSKMSEGHFLVLRG